MPNNQGYLNAYQISAPAGGAFNIILIKGTPDKKGVNRSDAANAASTQTGENANVLGDVGSDTVDASGQNNGGITCIGIGTIGGISRVIVSDLDAPWNQTRYYFLTGGACADTVSGSAALSAAGTNAWVLTGTTSDGPAVSGVAADTAPHLGNVGRGISTGADAAKRPVRQSGVDSGASGSIVGDSTIEVKPTQEGESVVDSVIAPGGRLDLTGIFSGITGEGLHEAAFDLTSVSDLKFDNTGTLDAPVAIRNLVHTLEIDALSALTITGLESLTNVTIKQDGGPHTDTPGVAIGSNAKSGDSARAHKQTLIKQSFFPHGNSRSCNGIVAEAKLLSGKHGVI